MSVYMLCINNHIYMCVRVMSIYVHHDDDDDDDDDDENVRRMERFL